MIAKFENLFREGRIGTLKLKNRIVLPAMATHYPAEDGSVSDQMIDYYAERAKGGAGLIIVEASFPRPQAPHRCMFNDDKFIPGLKKLVDAIHEAGAKAAIQLHPGRGRMDAENPESASGVPLTKQYQRIGIELKTLTIEDIERLEELCRQGAARVKKAGFDALEIHGAHGYTIPDFLSPLSNRRTDKYGGSLENRARLALELAQVIKKEVGDDYPVIFRIGVDERVEGGFSVKDGVAVCQMLERAGMDALDVDSGGAETYEYTVPPLCIPRGCNVELSAGIKKAVNIPVMVAGRINEPILAEEILQEGKADFIDIGRGLIADSDFPKKAEAGLVEDIRKCIACTDCMNLTYRAVTGFMACTVNPVAGREKELKIEPAKKAKNVLVVGGGPAGMEAARVAALRGHKVTLWEKSDKLGGQLILAVVPPYKGELNDLVEYYTTQIDKLGIKVELRKEATAASITELGSDVVIVAIGSTPLIPEIPGIEHEKVVTNRDVLAGKVDVGKRVVVLGGEMVGCETAEFLADRGNRVTVTRRGEEMASEVSPFVRWTLLPRLEGKGVRLLPKIKYVRITDEGLVIVDQEGKETLLEADSIVLAAGSTPNKELFNSLEGKVSELYAIGDCTQAGRIREAVYDGMLVGLKV